MARARNIKPGFFTNADLIELDPLARLLFIGLWCIADCRGILEDRPKTIKMKVLPGDTCDVDEMLYQLQSKGFIQRYESFGVRGIYIVNFTIHQNPHRNETPNTVPPPTTLCLDQNKTEQVSEIPSGYIAEVSESTPADSLLPITDSLLLNPDSLTPPTPSGVSRAKKIRSAGFEEWYGLYPLHVAVGRAEVAWDKLSGEDQALAMQRLREALAIGAFDPDPRYHPHPASWLNGKFWKDEQVEHRKRKAAMNGHAKSSFETMRDYVSGLAAPPVVESDEGIVDVSFEEVRR